MGIWLKPNNISTQFFKDFFNNEKLIQEIKKNEEKFSNSNSTEKICNILLNNHNYPPV